MHNFLKAAQQSGENIRQFADRLRQLARNCDFGDQTEKLIIGQMLLSMKDQELKAKLLMNDFPLDVIVARIHELEMTKYVLEQCQASGSQRLARESVARIGGKPSRGQDLVQCSRCNRRHARETKNCPAINERCHECGTVGHFASCCRKRKKNGSFSKAGRNPKTTTSMKMEPYSKEVGAMRSRVGARDPQWRWNRAGPESKMNS